MIQKNNENYFGNGEDLGVQIDYLREQSALGTVGALTLLDHKPSDSFVVTNGDVITDIRYGDLLDFHNERKNDFTLVASTKNFPIPYGVCELKKKGTLKKIIHDESLYVNFNKLLINLNEILIDLKINFGKILDEIMEIYRLT